LKYKKHQAELKVVEHQVVALKLLAEKAGAVFERRKHGKIMPRARDGDKFPCFHPLKLDHVQTTLALAERELARAARHPRRSPRLNRQLQD
jgi:hypothetical protein